MELSSACNLSFKPNHHPSSLVPCNKINKNNNLKASSYHQKQKPIKSCYSPSKYCSINNLHTTHPLGLYGKHKCLQSFSIRHLSRPNSINAWSNHQSEFPSTADSKASNFALTLLKYVRPTAFIAVSIIASSLYGAELLKNLNLFSWELMFNAFQGLVVILLYQMYVNGLNQIFDLESDRINKPHLPLASKEMSVESAWLLTIFSAIGGLLLMIKLKCGLFLTSMYCCYLAIGALYSAPPFKWKKNPFTSTLWTFLVFNMGLNFLVNYASRANLGLPFLWRPSFAYIFSFTTTLVILMSSLKDVPDVEGDKMVGMPTLPVIFGAKPVVLGSCGLLLLNYVAAIGLAIKWPQIFNSYIMIPAHAILASVLIYKTWLLNKANYAKEACGKYYHMMWILMIVEYILYPFMSH